METNKSFNLIQNAILTEFLIDCLKIFVQNLLHITVPTIQDIQEIPTVKSY